MAKKSSILTTSFHHLTVMLGDLDLQPTQANVSNGAISPQGEDLCQIILQLHKCRCYGTDKLDL